jgi:hypothetical protein
VTAGVQFDIEIGIEPAYPFGPSTVGTAYSAQFHAKRSMRLHLSGDAISRKIARDGAAGFVHVQSVAITFYYRSVTRTVARGLRGHDRGIFATRSLGAKDRRAGA